LAKHLDVSQSRLSDVERGQRSLSAEELLDVLRLFNVPATDFSGDARASESQMQNALERLGARHLRESSNVLPSEALKESGDVIREVLVAAESPRLIVALAAVLVAQVEQINFDRLHGQLQELGLQARLGWLLENTIEAATDLIIGWTPRRRLSLYQRAIALLQNALANVKGSSSVRRVRRRAAKLDILDRDARSAKTVNALIANGSPISRSWNIVTAIQVADFVEALGASRVGD
jgi:transcriptional regulator with XRE-family HTH domain